MRAVVLTGGLGTRLRRLTETPKGLLEIAGRPFLEYQFRLLRRFGFREIVLCIGYKGESIRDRFDDGSKLGARLFYSCEEDQLLGTGGALKKAEEYLSDRFLVLNGDSYLELDLDELKAFHASRSVLGTIAASTAEDAKDYGSLQLEKDGMITGFVEKSGTSGKGIVNAGVYLLEKEFLDLIPPGRVCSLEREAFPQAVAKGKRLCAFVSSNPFIDIGTPERYAKAEQFFKERGFSA